MGKHKRITHPEYGLLTKHHLVPRSRIRRYYGATYTLPNNLMKLWRFRHDAWHVLFKAQTLSETITYLKQKKSRAYAYKKTAWKVLFKNKSWHQVVAILKRARRMIRREHAHLELDPKLRQDINDLVEEYKTIKPVLSIINKQFKKKIVGPYLKAA